MKKSSQVFLIATVLVLCAGVVVGRLSARLDNRPPMPPPGHPPSWLADQLDLTPDQHQQMDAIWADVKQQLGSSWQKRRDLDHERDQQIQALLTDQQKLAYQKIFDDYRSKRQEMDKARDVLIKSAEERSRNLLSDSQKAKWDLLARDMHEHDHHPGPGGHELGGHGPGGPFGGGFGPTTHWSGGPGPDGGHPPDHDPAHDNVSPMPSTQP